MGLGHGNAAWWLATDAGRTWASTNRAVQSGLVLNLDAGASTSYPGSGTTWTNLVGTGNNGTLVNGPTYNSVNGGYIVFDGVDDYISIGSQSLVGSGNTPFSVELWFYNTKTLTSGQENIAIRVKQDTEFFVSLKNISGTFYIYAVFRGETQWGIPLTQSDYGNKWICLTAVYDGGDKNTAASYDIYSNGVILPTGTNNLGTAGGVPNCNLLGADGNSGCNATGGFYQGNIASYKVYNRALSAAEVLQNFNALKGRFVTSITATGGTIVDYTSGGTTYRAHIFTSSGTFQVTNVSGIGNVEYLVVAGGGGGGEDNAGGGGGGGYRTNVLGATSGGGGGAEASFTVSSGPYSIIVGGGGGGGVVGGNRGTSGTNSVFSTITSTGGGGGGGDTSGQRTGAVGGSGGGGAGNSSSAGGLGTANQGFAGGNGLIDANLTSIGGGGGGANAIGANAAGVQAGVGGAGAASSITGASATYGGGGGGGAQNGTAGAGGAGGGGAGATSGVGTPGTSSTGGGGGGGCTAGGDGGNGGSGIVIIRYIISS